MLTLLILLAALGGWGAARAATRLVRELPRSNDDLVYF